MQLRQINRRGAEVNQRGAEVFQKLRREAVIQ